MLNMYRNLTERPPQPVPRRSWLGIIGPRTRTAADPEPSGMLIVVGPLFAPCDLKLQEHSAKNPY